MHTTTPRLTGSPTGAPPEQGPLSTRARDAHAQGRDHTGFVRASVWRARGDKPMALAPGLREELANTASHVVGALLALVALPVLAAEGAARSSDRHLGVWVFAATLSLIHI